MNLISVELIEEIVSLALTKPSYHQALGKVWPSR
jgi:hypothetical protein